VVTGEGMLVRGCCGKAGAVIAAGIAQASGFLTLVQLSEVKYPTAVCTDGSRAGYYWKPAASPDASNLWLVYLQGGGWCYDGPSCTARCGSDPTKSTNPLCSSTGWETEKNLAGVFWPGAEDMALRDANKVYVRYCTSDGHMADAGASPTTGGRHFRGAAVVRAVFNELVVTHGLGCPHARGRHLVAFGGGSAGARGAMVHIDYVNSMLGAAGANVDVIGLLDSPLWLDIPPIAAGQVSLADTTRKVYSYGNVAHLGEECAALYKGPDAWKCLFAQYRLPTLRTPYFLVASQYDSFQLYWNIQKNPTTEPEIAYANLFANRTHEFMLELRSNWKQARPNSVFSWACYSHSVSLSDQGYNGYTSNGFTMRSAFLTARSWTNVPATQWVETCSGFNCGAGCYAAN